MNPKLKHNLVETGKAAALVGGAILLKKFGYPLVEEYLSKKREERKEESRNLGSSKANGWLNRILESECPANLHEISKNGAGKTKISGFNPDGF
jgi:hypothetical protein